MDELTRRFKFAATGEMDLLGTAQGSRGTVQLSAPVERADPAPPQHPGSEQSREVESIYSGEF